MNAFDPTPALFPSEPNLLATRLETLDRGRPQKDANRHNFPIEHDEAARLLHGSKQHAPIGATSKERAAESLKVSRCPVQHARSVIDHGIPEGAIGRRRPSPVASSNFGGHCAGSVSRPPPPPETNSLLPE